MDAKQHSGLALIIAGLKGKPEKRKSPLDDLLPKKKLSDEVDDDQGGDDDGLEMAMEDFSKAFEAKDFKAMAEAFEDACELCGSYDHDEDDDTPQMDDDHSGYALPDDNT